MNIVFELRDGVEYVLHQDFIEHFKTYPECLNIDVNSVEYDTLMQQYWDKFCFELIPKHYPHFDREDVEDLIAELVFNAIPE